MRQEENAFSFELTIYIFPPFSVKVCDPVLVTRWLGTVQTEQSTQQPQIFSRKGDEERTLKTR